MPKVSVITAVYCDIVEKIDWLIECIDSVRSQTMTDWEMVLIDDKSPREPTEAKFRYSDDPRIRWLENAENAGPAKTRNTAVAVSASECIIALDSDDMLAGPDVLDTLYNVWTRDQTKILYGNLQILVNKTGIFERHPKVHDFGEYSFELAMNLKGFIPVTAMHSKDCHIDAGGWKPELNAGLEDVEKWIMAGKRGYCGQRVNITSFLYRKQDKSRSYDMINVNEQFEVMQHKIKDMHKDVYGGKFPMACCGKGSTTPVVDPIVMSQQSQATGMIVPLKNYDEKELEWVKYIGPKNGRHDIVVRGATHLPPSYTIFGTGQVFQIHKNHHSHFEGLQRLGFQMNQPDPHQTEPGPEPVTIVERPPEITEVPAPQLSTILRIDSVAARNVMADVQPMPDGFIQQPLPNPVQSLPKPIHQPLPEPVSEAQENKFAQAERDYLQRMEEAAKTQIDNETKFSLVDLDLSPRLTDMLEQDSVRLWTVEKLARTTPQLLASYPGVGTKTANGIIAKAQELIGE